MTSETQTSGRVRQLWRTLQHVVVVALLVGLSAPASAHSPWGQYQVYRQQHLLILSSRDDPPTYPYSKVLASAINTIQPNASARPARAKDQQRVIELLRTNQMQFALASRENVTRFEQTLSSSATTQFTIEVVYKFGELLFVTRSDMASDTIAILTHAILESRASLPDAAAPETLLNNDRLHAGARMAIQEFVDHAG